MSEIKSTKFGVALSIDMHDTMTQQEFEDRFRWVMQREEVGDLFIEAGIHQISLANPEEIGYRCPCCDVGFDDKEVFKAHLRVTFANSTEQANHLYDVVSLKILRKLHKLLGEILIHLYEDEIDRQESTRKAKQSIEFMGLMIECCTEVLKKNGFNVDDIAQQVQNAETKTQH